jgi:hypothetical protein
MRAVEQFHRVKRYLEKLRLISAGDFPAVVGNPEDEIFSFFVHCHNLKDWVDKDESLAFRDKVGNFFHSNPLLTKCADISNGHKHMGLDPKSPTWKKRPFPKIQPTLSNLSQTITIYPKSAQRLPTAAVAACVVSDDGEIGFLELAEACVQAWTDFFKANNAPDSFFR